MSSELDDVTAQRSDDVVGSLKTKATGLGPGRLLVPLLIGLSVLALAVAALAIWLQTQEREKRHAKERELVVVSAQRDDLRLQVAELREATAKLEDAMARTQQELSTAHVQLAQLEETRSSLSQSVADRDREITRLRQEMEQLRTERKELAVKIGQFDSQRESLQQQLAEAERQRSEFEAKLHDLSGWPTVQLDKIVVTGDDAAAGPADAAAASEGAGPLPRSGQVIVVNRKYDFIVMNLGKNHGLSIGQEFQVVQGDEVLGRVRVEKVYDELSAATILPDSKKDSIKEGDTVQAL